MGSAASSSGSYEGSPPLLLIFLVGSSNAMLRLPTSRLSGRGKLTRRGAQRRGILGHGDGVQIDDTEDVVELVLIDYEVAHGAQIVAQMDGARGVNAGKDTVGPWRRFPNAGRRLRLARAGWLVEAVCVCEACMGWCAHYLLLS